jgi:signal peptidase II
MFKRLFTSTPFILALVIFVADQASKAYIYTHIPLALYNSMWYPYNGIPVFENFGGIEFSIVHAHNKGAAWGVLANYQLQLLIFRILLILGMIVYLFFLNKNRSYTIPLTLVVTGALGNVVDYFVYGQVIDMLHFVLWGYDFPVFNIADSAITIGIVWMCLITWCCTPSKKKYKPAR